MGDLIGTVASRGAQDVIYAWELGNELHTPRQPDALVPFITSAVQEVRTQDPLTPILPGTMDTPMLAQLPEAARQALAAGIPFPKRLGTPDDYAKLAEHIVENGYLNGETIRLDGALRMPPK